MSSWKNREFHRKVSIVANVARGLLEMNGGIAHANTVQMTRAVNKAAQFLNDNRYRYRDHDDSMVQEAAHVERQALLMLLTNSYETTETIRPLVDEAAE